MTTIEAGKVYRTKDGLRVVAKSNSLPKDLYLCDTEGAWAKFNDPNGYPVGTFRVCDLTGPLTGVQAAVKGSLVRHPEAKENLTVAGCAGDVLFIANSRGYIERTATAKVLEFENWALVTRAAFEIVPADDGYAYRKDGTKLGKVVERQIYHKASFGEMADRETVRVIVDDEAK